MRSRENESGEAREDEHDAECGFAVFAALLMLLFLSGAYRNDLFRRRHSRQPAVKEVTIDNFSFGPMEMTIPGGHASDMDQQGRRAAHGGERRQKFKSQALDTDEKFSFTFQEPGTYEYFCSVHPKMTGKIVVK